MLTAKQIAVVKSTVPVLQEHGQAVTTAFYQFLFDAHPELHNVFNPANQRDGGQSRSLAAAICMYAANIDQPEMLSDMVSRIAHKHGSLEVQAEHYPVVGRHLLQAIRAVMGEAATDEVLDAWGAAYGVLAEIMIGAESQLYKASALAEGGWRGFKPFIVTAKVPESSLITSFYLKPADKAPLPDFRPGQYISVRLEDIPGQMYAHIRQYSLSSIPEDPYLRISVKREPAPPGSDQESPTGVVSNHLHDRVCEGDLVSIHAPLGDFVLDESSTRPIVLLGGGVGVTPLLSMLHHLDRQKSQRELLFVQAVLGREQHAFADEIARIIGQHPNMRRVVFYNQCTPNDVRGEHYDEEGFVCLESLQRYFPTSFPVSDADFYCCGPVGFMGAVGGILDELGVIPARRHHETFGPSPTFIVRQ